MNTRFSQHITALMLAAFVTLGLLAGVNGLADSGASLAKAQLAQAQVGQQA